MSSQNKLSFWQRIKRLLAADDKRSSADSATNNSSLSSDTPEQVNILPLNTDLVSEIDNDGHSKPSKAKGQNRYTGSRTVQSKNHNASNTDTPKKATKDSDTSSSVNTSHNQQTEDQNASLNQSKFITLSNLDESDGMKRRSSSYQYSDKPITDAILDFLEASDLSYFYHHPDNSGNLHAGAEDDNNSHVNDDANENIDDATVASADSTPKPEGNQPNKNKVHHISMAMRYHHESSTYHNSEQSDLDDSLDGISTTHSNDLEWGCVIRIHEHTQLVAMYGVLPFRLPPSHLQAGITLAAQLNYDMMLGCVEIDIRDGEIRFKNSIDIEPIMNTSGGVVPPMVINYMLKGVMAMTSSFAPLFSDLINSDPEAFELHNVLDQLHKLKAENTFFLASTTPQ